MPLYTDIKVCAKNEFGAFGWRLAVSLKKLGLHAQFLRTVALVILFRG